MSTLGASTWVYVDEDDRQDGIERYESLRDLIDWARSSIPIEDEAATAAEARSEWKNLFEMVQALGMKGVKVVHGDHPGVAARRAQPAN